MNAGWGGGVAIESRWTLQGWWGEWRLTPGMAASRHGFSNLPRNYHLPWLASAQLTGVPGSPSCVPALPQSRESMCKVRLPDKTQVAPLNLNFH